MKKMKTVRIVPVITISFLLILGVGNAAVYNCNDCDECNGKIASASSGDIIYLTKDILNHEGICIEFDHGLLPQTTLHIR